MNKLMFYLRIFSILFLTLLSGCVSSVWTGTSMLYNRHDLHKKFNDFQLFNALNGAIFVDRGFKNKGCAFDLAVFHGDVLLVGHLPTEEYMVELKRRISPIKGYRRLFNDIKVTNEPSNALQDGWITAKIRSQILADDSIDPNAFKVMTSDQVVYLMGDVERSQAEKVVTIARGTQGVARVVKIFKYYVYQN